MDNELGHALVSLARHSIASAVGVPMSEPTEPNDPSVKARLDAPGATFVTLTIGGRLRGCIGSMEAIRPLREDCAARARAAALHDPRFPPVSSDEYDRLDVEVSLLSPTEPMTYTDEDDALAQLRPGTDGVLLETPGHRAVFLPQVWQQLPQPRQFLSALKRKAGLPEDYWHSSVRLSRYTVESFEEKP